MGMPGLNVKSKKDLPSDPQQLKSLLWELQLAYLQLTEKYRKLLADKYGKSSEKLKHSQLDALQVEMDAILDQVSSIEQESASKQQEQETIEVTPHRRRRRHPGRNAIDESLIEEVEIDVSAEDKICDGCGKQMPEIDRKAHVVVERIPARYKVTRYIRPVYGCSGCKDKITVAEPVITPIAKGIAGPQLLSFVILSKIVYHLPLYRIQRQIFHESSIWFTRSTLSSWLRKVCEMLQRIHEALLLDYRASRIKHADETPLQVRYENRYGEGWMWVGLSGNNRTAVFLFDKHRSGKAAMRLLKGSNPGDYLMVDDCPSYHKTIKQLCLIDLRCMVHIRRRFVDARKAGCKEKYVNRILIKIGQLYRIERLATKISADTKTRGELRKRYSSQIMIQIKGLLDNPGFSYLPQSTIGKAIDHFKKNWKQATRFLESGELPIDNSADERIIRPFAIGRKNWLQAGSENGAQWLAILYSICTTCKLNGIDVHEYLSDVLMRLPIRPANADISDLTPVGWYKAKNEGKEPPLTPLYPSKN